MFSTALLVCILGCDGTGSTEPGPGVVQGRDARDTLVIATAFDQKDLLSPFATAALDLQVLELIGATLLASDFDCGLVFRPRLATAWSWSEDGKTLAMTLRDDVKWSDGEPVDADDVKAFFDLVTDPAAQSPRAYLAQKLVPGAGPRVVDAHHLEFEFVERGDPTAMLALVASLPPVPAHRLAGIDPAAIKSSPLNVQAPLASGPWQVREWTRGDRLVLEPNPGWPGARPGLDRVIFRVIPDYATRVLELERGGVDLVENITVTDADRLLEKAPDVRLVRRGVRGQHDIMWNGIDPAEHAARIEAAAAKGKPPDLDRLPPHPLFGQPAVRRALTRAIDVDTILRDVATSMRTGEVYGRPSVGTISPALCGYHNDALVPIAHDTDGARAGLAKAGWSDTNGDGVVDKDGRPFRFTLSTSAGSDTRRLIAERIKAQLAKVGVDAQVETMESGALGERLRNRQFDAALWGWSAALYVDPTSEWGRDSDYNYASYQEPRALQLLSRGLAEPDPQRAQGTWREFQSVVYADQPWTFLYWIDELVAVSKRFENTTIDVVSPYRRLEEWTVPPGSVKRATLPE